MGLAIRLLHGKHEKCGVGEQVIHFLEWAFGSFWKDDPEEYSVCQVTNATFTVSKGNDAFWCGRQTYDEEETVLITDLCHSGFGHLSKSPC